MSAVDEARETLLMWLYNEIDVVAEGAWTDTFKRRLDALIAAVRAETLDVDRLAIATSRAVVWCEQQHPAGYSMTGDVVPRIAVEYEMLGTPALASQRSDGRGRSERATEGRGPEHTALEREP